MGAICQSRPDPGQRFNAGANGSGPRQYTLCRRPCYFGLELDDTCDANYWTYARYSEKVVGSMVDVIAEQTRQYSEVVLLGHSGGGAMALLIAEQLPNVTAVVTIAGNIDTEAWTQHHGYTPLYGLSLIHI